MDWSRIKKMDWLLLGAVLTLCAISLLTLYSVNYGKPGFVFFQKQVFFVGLGLVIMLSFSFFDLRLFKNQPLALVVVYLAGLGLLASLLIFGQRVRGVYSWLSFSDLSFQPVELIKLIVILVLAKYFSLRHIEMYRARHVVASAMYVILPSTLILAQPDLGSAIILGAIWLGTVILAGIKLKHLALVFVGVVIIFSAAWFGALKPYQKERLLTFVNPQKDPFGASYNLIQSKIAIGSGGLFGRGLGQGIQGRLDFLPEKHSDFIFAAYAEEWGFLGILFLLSIFGLLFFRLIKISLHCADNFSRLFCAGVCLLIFSELFINVGVNLGLLPITGISLPFISYGGSGLIINFLAISLVQGLVIRGRG